MINENSTKEDLYSIISAMYKLRNKCTKKALISVPAMQPKKPFLHNICKSCFKKLDVVKCSPELELTVDI